MKNILSILLIFAFGAFTDYEYSTAKKPIYYSEYGGDYSFISMPMTTSLPSFIEGQGSNWVWPASYEVRIVTNLSDAGAGTLRDACETTTTADGVIVVFNGLSGRIQTQSTININQAGKYWVIAGQTSENGIIVSADNASGDFSPFVFDDAAGSITQAMTFAAGDVTVLNGCCSDSFDWRGGTNHVADLCNFIWGSDETFSMTTASDWTIQRSILSEPLVRPAGWAADRGYTMLISDNATKGSWYRNVFSHHQQRGPLIGGGSPDPPGTDFEFVQNVSYNWGFFNFVAAAGDNKELNIINNVTLLPSGVTKTRYSYAIDSNNGAVVYAKGNYNDKRTLATDPEFDAIGCATGCTTYMVDPLPVANQTTTPFDYPLKDVPILTKQEVIDVVLADVGDPHFLGVGGLTQRLIDDVENLTGDFIDNPSEVGGYPTIAAGTIITDSDSDGIPDSEESTWGDDTFSYVQSLIGPLNLESEIQARANSMMID